MFRLLQKYHWFRLNPMFLKIHYFLKFRLTLKNQMFHSILMYR
jgi:hypothetical protein